MADGALRGTWAGIERETTPMWRSTPVHPPYEPNWVRNVFFYNGIQWVDFKQECEPEIPDYMRVSEGL